MADSQRKTANLFNKDTDVVPWYIDTQSRVVSSSGGSYSIVVPCEANQSLICSFPTIPSVHLLRAMDFSTYPSVGDLGTNYSSQSGGGNSMTFITSATAKYVMFFLYNSASGAHPDMTAEEFFSQTMLNTGSTPLPYEPYGWLHSLRKLTTAAEAVENPLYSDGTAITAYNIKGNEEHTGTPTPSNPVDVNGVGNKTANLWNEDYTGISDNIIYKPVYVGDGQFTMSNNEPRTSDLAALLFLLAGNVSSGASSGVNGVWDEQSRTVTSIDGYVTVAYRTVRTYTPVGSQTMLNTGSTAKPYEPYGYKIPISSGGVTTNIYLGSTQTLRQIKKLVLNGTEDWTSTGGGVFYSLSISQYMSDRNDLLSTHFFVGNYSGVLEIGQLRGDGTPSNTIIFNYDNGAIGVDGFKSWLAAQYTNGTPVTVWYVLTTPETAALNEPLMKIGDYADTLSNAVAIPTAEGANSITVDTTVQPSEFTATWTGWHDASIKEWDGSQWQ